jgi:hypothetical protein
MDSPDPENIIPFSNPADQAFVQADNFEFLGEPLQPFSVRRQLAAQAIGNRLLSGRIVEDQAGLYDGQLADAIGVIYLCRCPVSELFLALRKPDTVLENSLVWAESRGIHSNSQAMLEALSVYTQIIKALKDAQFSVVENSSEGSPAKKE